MQEHEHEEERTKAQGIQALQRQDARLPSTGHQATNSAQPSAQGTYKAERCCLNPGCRPHLKSRQGAWLASVCSRSRQVGVTRHKDGMRTGMSSVACIY